MLEAELHVSNGDVQAGIDLLREAIVHDADSPLLRVRLAEILLADGDAEGAAQSARLALERHQEHPEALRLLGASLVVAGERAAAKDAFARCLAAAPDNAPAAEQYLELLVEDDELDAAQRLVASLLEKNVKAADASLVLARLFAEHGDVTRSLAHLDSVLTRTPNRADALALKLGLLYALGRFDESVAVADALRQEQDEDQAARVEVLTSRLLAGRLDEAHRLAEEWLADPGNGSARARVSEAFERAGHIDKALSVLEHPTMTDPRGVLTAARLHLSRHEAPQAAKLLCVPMTDGQPELREFAQGLCARALSRAGQGANAGRVLLDALAQAPTSEPLLTALVDVFERDPRSLPPEQLESLLFTAANEDEPVATLSARVRVRERQGNHAAARELLDAALQRAPTDPDILVEWSRFLERQGQVDGAIEIAERVLARRRSGLDVLNYLAFVLADHGRRSTEARELAWRAVLRDPLNGYVLDTLGWAELAAGDPTSAVDTLTRANLLAPGEGEIWFHLSRAHHALGRSEEARAAALESLRLLEPHDRVRPRAEGHLRALGGSP